MFHYTAISAWVSLWSTSCLPFMFLFFWLVAQMKNRETLSLVHSCLQNESGSKWRWSSPELIPIPQLYFVTKLACASSSWNSTTKYYTGKLMESILVFWGGWGGMVCLLCILENRSLEIFIKSLTGCTTLPLVKLLQSVRMRPFSGMWPRLEANQEREIMHV